MLANLFTSVYFLIASTSGTRVGRNSVSYSTILFFHLQITWFLAQLTQVNRYSSTYDWWNKWVMHLAVSVVIMTDNWEVKRPKLLFPLIETNTDCCITFIIAEFSVVQRYHLRSNYLLMNVEFKKGGHIFRCTINVADGAVIVYLLWLLLFISSAIQVFAISLK